MTEELPFCECGKCGLRVTKKGNRFIHGHNRRGIYHPHTTPAQIAADDAKRGIPRSPEVGAAVSAAKLGKPHTSTAQIAADKANAERRRGVPLSPKTCAKMSSAQLGILHTSPSQIASDERQRGGNDIVEHHYIYDHADLSLTTVKMTRSDHSKLHRLLRKLGYIVPHINTGHEDKVLQPKGL